MLIQDFIIYSFQNKRLTKSLAVFLKKEKIIRTAENALAIIIQLQIIASSYHWINYLCLVPFLSFVPCPG